MIAFDIEIKRCICKRGEKKQKGVEYCEGFNDTSNMGISTICLYDFDDSRYHVFCDDNLDEFIQLAKIHNTLVSFNGKGFDNKVISSEIPELPLGYLDGKSYDIFDEIRKTTGKWCSLDALAQANRLKGKSANGAMAPIWYQTGQWGKLVNYCIYDVWLTVEILKLITEGNGLVCPKGGPTIYLDRPYLDPITQNKETGQ